MKHYIKNDIYYLEDEKGEVVFTLSIEKEFENQVVITTAKEVYAGPVDCLSFWADIPEHEIK